MARKSIQISKTNQQQTNKTDRQTVGQQHPPGALSEMSWPSLLKLASTAGVLRKRMTRAEIERALGGES